VKCGNYLRYAGDCDDGVCRLEKIWHGTCSLRDICDASVAGRRLRAYYETFDVDTAGPGRMLDGVHVQGTDAGRTYVWRVSGNGSGAGQL